MYININYKLWVFNLQFYRLFSHGQLTQIMNELKLLSLAFLYNLACHSKLCVLKLDDAKRLKLLDNILKFSLNYFTSSPLHCVNEYKNLNFPDHKMI